MAEGFPACGFVSAVDPAGFDCPWSDRVDGCSDFAVAAFAVVAVAAFVDFVAVVFVVAAAAVVFAGVAAGIATNP